MIDSVDEPIECLERDGAEVIAAHRSKEKP
jgi:hypothetical protein